MAAERRSSRLNWRILAQMRHLFLSRQIIGEAARLVEFGEDLGVEAFLPFPDDGAVDRFRWRTRADLHARADGMRPRGRASPGIATPAAAACRNPAPVSGRCRTAPPHHSIPAERAAGLEDEAAFQQRAEQIVRLEARAVRPDNRGGYRLDRYGNCHNGRRRSPLLDSPPARWARRRSASGSARSSSSKIQIAAPTACSSARFRALALPPIPLVQILDPIAEGGGHAAV